MKITSVALLVGSLLLIALAYPKLKSHRQLRKATKEPIVSRPLDARKLGQYHRCADGLMQDSEIWKNLSESPNDPTIFVSLNRSEFLKGSETSFLLLRGREFLRIPHDSSFVKHGQNSIRFEVAVTHWLKALGPLATTNARSILDACKAVEDELVSRAARIGLATL